MSDLNGSCLIDACNDGDLDAVRRLLDEGRNANEITEEGESLLSLACSSGYYELAQLLLATRANVEDPGPRKETTPLMEAASAGHVGIVKLLLSHGAHVNAKTPQGNTPLMYACAGGHIDVVKLLIEHGANVEDHNANGHTPLMEAASAGHVAVAKILVENGASINSHSDEFKESALTLACYKGHLEMVRFLLGAGADQEHKTEEMHTALMEASMDGHVEVARLLLDSGAQVNMPADSFESPLTLASCGGHVELAMLLLERGANIEEVNDEGYTPLMEAAREGQEEMVALLLSQGADINAQTEETQETALTLACCSNSLEVAEFLIKAGADIERGANTPLMEASQEGHLELVKHLIAAGANVNATTASGETALMYACENGHTNVAEILLDAGADLEHEAEAGRTGLMKAARAGHLCTVQFLVSRGGNINKVTSNNDHTPLSLACAGGHITVVEYLLSQGADPTQRLKDNSTMLIEAARGGHTKVVQLLIDYSSRVSRSPIPDDIATNHHNTTNGTNLTDSGDKPGRIVHRSSISHDHLNNDLPSTSQRKSSISSINPSGIVGKHSIPKTSRSKALTSNISNPTKSSHSVEPYVPHPAKGRSTLNTVSNNNNNTTNNTGKHLERSLSDSSASQFFNSVTSLTNSDALSSQCSSSGARVYGNNKDAGISQRINELKLNDSDKVTSTREEKILHKQKILEELVRVEKELQESRQERLSLHHKAEQQQQLIQSLCCGSDLSTLKSNCQASEFPASLIPSLTNPGDTPTDKANISQQQMQVADQLQHQLPSQQLNDLASNVSSQTMLTLDMSVVKNPLKLGDSLNFQLPTNLTSHGRDIPTNQQQMFIQNLVNLNNTGIEKSTPPNGLSECMLDREPSSPVVPQVFNAMTNISSSIPSFSFTSRNTLATQTPTTATSYYSSSTVTSSASNRSRARHSSKMKNIKGVNLNQLLFDPKQASTVQPVTTIESAEKTSQLVSTNNEQNVQCNSISSTILLTSEASNFSPQFSTANSPVLSLSSAQSNDANQAIYVQRQQALLELAQNISSRPDALQLFQQSTNFNANLPLFFPSWVDNNSLDNLSHLQRFIDSSQQHPLENADDIVTSIPTNMTLPVISSTTANQPSCLPIPAPPLLSHENLVESQTQTSITTSEEVSMVSSTSVGTNTITPSSPTADKDTSSSPPPWYPPIDLNSQTDSNHDTALTLACAGGHEELVELLISRGANLEHRDKKGFTPLMLAASGGKVKVCEILLDHAAEIEAQSERTKDTALSLACSSGRYEVVELLLQKGANKEHRNVSDYTPLSLAASGGYVNIIKLLLSHGAEINSRTGSKLGISPLMLAAMNGHAPTVKLLLDMGSDINAQIETNRNTALTLACFQGRCEVVSLLLDRKANVEHRAKTGLTPLMEAASGGYVDVGRVLLDKGADVNAPPVPSSRDTALTIAADKGHFRFVELLLQRGAQVDVKNKKGSSPLWLACNGGHLDVVQLLVNAKADIDSQDNRKVSCLMAAFRKGHVKVVKWMVKHVTQFPSDQEMTRYMAMITDKELLKKCHQCMEHIRAAKEKQAAEANKNATILLEEIDMERYREETRKQAAARRREKKRQKKKEKQEKEKALKAAQEIIEKQTGKRAKFNSKKIEESLPLEDSDVDDSDSESDEEVPEVRVNNNKINHTNQSPSKEFKKESSESVHNNISKVEPSLQQNAKKKAVEKNKKNQTHKENTVANEINERNKKRDEILKDKKHAQLINHESSPLKSKQEVENSSNCIDNLHKQESSIHTCHINKSTSVKYESETPKSLEKSTLGSAESSKRSSQDHGTVSDNSHEYIKDNERIPGLRRSPDMSVSVKSTSSSLSSGSVSVNGSGSVAPTQGGVLKGPKREEGWKEVVRRSKKVSVPNHAISRVIGRGGCNINAVREISGAHIEVEKQKGQGDRQIIIKGSADATRHAQQLINGLVNEPDKDLSQIVTQLGLSRTNSSTEDEPFSRGGPVKSYSTATLGASSPRNSSANIALSLNLGVSKSCSVSAVFTPNSNLTNTVTAPFAPKPSGVVNIRPVASIPNAASPFASTNSANFNAITSSTTNSNVINSTHNASSNMPGSPKFSAGSARIQTSAVSSSFSCSSLGTKTTLSYTTAVSTKAKPVVKSSTQLISNIPHAKFITGDAKPSGPPAFATAPVRPQTQPFNSMSRLATPTSQPQQPPQPQVKTTEHFKQPAFNNSSSSSLTTSSSVPIIVASNASVVTTLANSKGTLQGSTPAPEYTPFNNFFSKVAQASVWKQSKESHKPNFASVAAAGISSVASNQQPTSTITSSLSVPSPPAPELDINVDASKAPGYRGNLHVTLAQTPLSTTPTTSSSTFGPIGSGPRSAPCTPPLGIGVPIGSPASRTHMSSTSNTAPTTPPPMRPSIKESSPSPYSVTDLPVSNNSNTELLLANSGTNYSVADNAITHTGFSPSMSSNVYASSVASHTIKQPNFCKASNIGNVTRPFVTTSAFTQHGSLTSVESIHSVPVMSSMSSPENLISMGQSVSQAIPGSMNVAQSSLNPNAPDFSVRTGNNFVHSPSHQPNTSTSSVRNIQQQMQQRSMTYSDVMPNVQGAQINNSQQQNAYRMTNSAMQIHPSADVSMQQQHGKKTDVPRNPYISFLHLFNQTANLQSLASLQTQINQISSKVIPPPYPPYPPPPQPSVAPYQLPNQSFNVANSTPGSHVSGNHPAPNHANVRSFQQGHATQNDYTPPETIRLLQTALNAAANSSINQNTANIPQYGMIAANYSPSQLSTMQAAINMRQHQINQNTLHQQQPHPQPQQAQGQHPQRLNSLDLAVNAAQINSIMAVKENELADLSEERRLPRPIGTERAQKKNPIYSVSGTPMDASQETNLWPFNQKVPNENSEWLIASANSASAPLSAPAGNLTAEMTNSVASNYHPNMNQNYLPLSESSSHESEYNVNYHYFSSNI